MGVAAWLVIPPLRRWNQVGSWLARLAHWWVPGPQQGGLTPRLPSSFHVHTHVPAGAHIHTKRNTGFWAKVQQPIFRCYKDMYSLSSQSFPIISMVCESLLCPRVPQFSTWHITGLPSTAGIEAGKTYPLPRFRKPWYQQNGCLSVGVQCQPGS